jgi:hypothetical protein
MRANKTGSASDQNSHRSILWEGRTSLVLEKCAQRSLLALSQMVQTSLWWRSVEIDDGGTWIAAVELGGD